MRFEPIAPLVDAVDLIALACASIEQREDEESKQQRLDGEIEHEGSAGRRHTGPPSSTPSRCRFTMAATAYSATATESASITIRTGRRRSGCGAPSLRLAMPNDTTNTPHSQSGRTSSVSTARGMTTNWKLQSARSGCCT